MEDRANRIERVIAGARLILSLSAICLVFVYPEFSVQGGSATYSVLAWYFFYSLTVVWVADRGLVAVKSLGIYTQAIDTLWFPVILICTQGENSPFFLYYVFSLITASSRWGFNQTLFVNTANVGMYLIVHLMTTSAAEFGFFKFWARPTYLYVLACLIGYLGEHQRRAQNQLLSLAELSSSIRVNDRTPQMLNQLIDRVRQLFQAEQGILVYRDEELDQYLLMKTRAGLPLQSSSLLELSQAEAAFLVAPHRNWGYLENPHKRVARVFGLKDVLAFDFDSQKPVTEPFRPNQHLGTLFDMRSILSVPIVIRETFKGRVYLVNKLHDNFAFADMQYLRLIVSQVWPQLENYRLLKRMQTVSILEEKSRIGRDLHDGLAQSLATLDLRLEACRRMNRLHPQSIDAELEALQRIVRSENRSLRNYMKELKPPALSGHQLSRAIQAYAESFQRENGLSVSLSIDPDAAALPGRVGGEIFQMIQEGLANVRKHAGAHQVSIQLRQQGEMATLVIQDDGRGFPDQPQAGSAPERPWSIAERSRDLRGTLRVDSSPGKGSTLTIQVPLGGEENDDLG